MYKVKVMCKKFIVILTAFFIFLIGTSKSYSADSISHAEETEQGASSNTNETAKQTPTSNADYKKNKSDMLMLKN